MMKKRMLSLLLALTLLFGAACAEELRLAASPVNLTPLERYAACREKLRAALDRALAQRED